MLWLNVVVDAVYNGLYGGLNVLFFKKNVLKCDGKY